MMQNTRWKLFLEPFVVMVMSRMQMRNSVHSVLLKTELN